MKARPRTFSGEEQFIFPLPVEKRHSSGDAVTVEHYSDFVLQWGIFSEMSLSEIDWSNVIVAGGSVLAWCIACSAGIQSIQAIFAGLLSKKGIYVFRYRHISVGIVPNRGLWQCTKRAFPNLTSLLGRGQNGGNISCSPKLCSS